jgi:nicotinamidase-related amidase
MDIERVWDRFLTPQDRAALQRLPTPARDPRTYCHRPALLCIDHFRGAYGDRPQPILESIELWPGSCGLVGWEAIPSTQRLLARARALAIPIIHTTGIIEGGVEGQHATPPPASGVTANGRRWIAPEVRYEIIPELAPVAGETVIHKISSSAFWGTPLVGQLIKNRIDTVIVVGETTSGCIRASVVDGDQYQFHMIVVEDCTFDRHESTHALNLFDMWRKFADVISLDATLDLLDHLSVAESS